ncbi:MAG: aromatic ring-hydroxylating dioxygenase subunit alpha [Alphaproteobacteria bacterium]|nr:aromatic ring-hydroxylating dioxygenase subunit alpha [Alphaproteobacteria bacterium]
MEQTGASHRSLDALAPKVTAAWYIACRVDALGAGPVRSMVHGRPMVVFRGAGGDVSVLVDRCPHRNVPLSFGRVVGDTIQCGYHGWRFDGEGTCTHVPGLPGDAGHPARRATVVPSVVQQGFVWVWPDADVAPHGTPFRFRHLDDPAYTTVCRSLPSPGSVFMVVENALDVPHTAFLHGGLFRDDTAQRREVTCHIRRFHDRAECAFVGERRPSGIAGRLLSPSGGDISHVDRFHLPSITEVEYRLGDENHVLLNGACTPVDDTTTIVHAVVSIRSRLPGWLVRPIVQPLALRIFAQDVEVLRLQVDTLQAFGDATFVSTDIDVLGTHILRLMHRAARGDAGDPEAPPFERTTTMLV